MSSVGELNRPLRAPKSRAMRLPIQLNSVMISLLSCRPDHAANHKGAVRRADPVDSAAGMNRKEPPPRRLKRHPATQSLNCPTLSVELLSSDIASWIARARTSLVPRKRERSPRSSGSEEIKSSSTVSSTRPLSITCLMDLIMTASLAGRSEESPPCTASRTTCQKLPSASTSRGVAHHQAPIAKIAIRGQWRAHRPGD